MPLSTLLLAAALSIPLSHLLVPHLPSAIPISQSLLLALLLPPTYTLLTHLTQLVTRLRPPFPNPHNLRIIRYADLPGPRARSLLWGLEKTLYDDSPPGGLLMQWSRRFGDVYAFRGVLGAPNITLTSPASLHHILTSAVYTYPKPLGGRLWLGNLLGEGVLVSEGERHARQRRLLARAFTPQALRGMRGVFEGCAEKVVDAWRGVLGPEGGAAGKELSIDVQYWANRISLDAIGLAGFAYSFGSLDSAIEGISPASGSGTVPAQQHPLAQTLDKLTDSSGTFAAFVLRAVLFVWPGVLRMPSKRTKSIGEVRRSLGEEVKRVRSEAGGIEGRTVLGILEKQAAEDGNGMDDEEVEAQIMTLVFAGYETTSTAISWVLYELAHHPETQSALRAELASPPPPPITSSQTTTTTTTTATPAPAGAAHPTPLLDATIRETLRLRPPILDLHREAVADDLVPLGDGRALWVDKGTIVYVPLNVLGRAAVPGSESQTQTQTEAEDGDGDVWRPERWLRTENDGEKKEKAESPGQNTLWAFSDGPRVCIGRAFAIAEIKTVLTALIKNFAFAPDPQQQVEPFVSFVVRPRVVGERRSRLPLLVRRVG